MKKLFLLILFIIFINDLALAYNFTIHDKMFANSKDKGFSNTNSSGNYMSQIFISPSGAEALVVYWNPKGAAHPSIKHDRLMEVLEIAGIPIGKKKNFKSRANEGTPASYRKYTSNDNKECFTFFNVLELIAVFGYICNEPNGNSFSDQKIKDLIDSIESSNRRIPDSLKNKELVAKKLQTEIAKEKDYEKEISKIRINTDSSLRARITTSSTLNSTTYCLDKKGIQRECDSYVFSEKWNFFYLKKIAKYYQIIESSSNECLGSKGKFIKRFTCSDNDNVLWEIIKYEPSTRALSDWGNHLIKNISNGKCMMLRSDSKTYLLDCIDDNKNLAYQITANRGLEWDNKGVFIKNDEDNITSSAKSSDSDCLDNLESLSDEELIACGVAQGWVDEETGIVTPPDSQTNSTNQESSSSNVQNYDLNLTIFWDEIGDGIEATMSVADDKGTSGTVVLKDSKLGLDCSGGWTMTKGSFSGPDMPSGQWVLTCTNGLIANGKIKAKETYLGSGVGTDNKGRNIQFIYQRN